MGAFRSAFGGMTAMAPRSFSRARQGVAVESLVGDQSREIEAGDERLDADAVVTLAGQQDEARQIAQGIDQSHDLGRQPAARLADGLILSPPFAPVPCR
jgi:hypothetical protein